VTRMATETPYESFKYKSTGRGEVLLKVVGLMIIWSSRDDFSWWLHPSFELLPHLFVGSVFGLLFVAAGAMLLLNSCQIEILEGQLRFRRFFAWQSVPLGSVTSMRLLWVLVYLRIDYGGRRRRLIFAPASYKFRWTGHPVKRFLREVCKRNAESRASAGGADFDF
jgi:hypothetical protein